MQTEPQKQNCFDPYACLVFVLAVVVTWPCILLEVPFGGDNPVHYSKIIALYENLLNGDGLFSWTHLWFGGYPTNFNYPIAPYFLVIGIRFLTLGFLSFDATYGLSILIMFFTIGFGVYLLASKIMPRYMALVAACFALMDGGGPAIGGYVWLVRYGCWPGGFAIGLCFVALALYVDAFRTHLVRNYQKAAIFLAAALFSHPISIIFLFLMIPAFAVYNLLQKLFGRTVIISDFRYLVISLIFSMLGGLFQIGPLLYGAQFADGMGGNWITFSEFYQKFFSFELFPNLNPVSACLLVIGSLLSVFFTRRLNRFLGLVGLGILVFSTRDVGTSFFNQISSLVVRNVEFARIVWLAKVCLFVASTGALYSVFVFLARTEDRRVNFALISVLIVIGITASSIWRWPSFTRYPHFRTLWKSQLSAVSNLAEMEKWLCALQLSENNFFRVASDVGDHNMDHFVYYLASNCNIPLIKLGFTPATSFRYRYGGVDLDELQRLGVKYLMADKEINHPNLKRADQFKNIVIYDVVGFQGPSTVIQGQATVVLNKWTQNFIQYEISNSKDAVIEIPVTDIGYWVVTQNSHPIKTLNLATKNSRGGGYGKGGGQLFLVRVPVEDGPLKLEYSPPLTPRILSYLGIIVWLFMIVTYWIDLKIFKSLIKRWTLFNAPKVP